MSGRFPHAEKLLDVKLSAVHMAAAPGSVDLEAWALRRCRDSLFDICLDFGRSNVEDMSRHLPRNLGTKRYVMSCRDICHDISGVMSAQPLAFWGAFCGSAEPMEHSAQGLIWTKISRVSTEESS